MSIATIRRQVKNVAYNFSDAQVKVREATSNDPWGPSTGLMSEIADLSNNPAAFTEIMSIIWKRLNDHGKNWRHVYKSLVLLDFLIKCGSEKVAAQCRENIYSIETLRDFQHVEEGRDQGMNVREKAKQMAALLQDEERLKNERTRFMLTRNRFKQSSGVGHETRSSTSAARAQLPAEYDEARPGSLGEEEMQMQIALALSKEEHEREEEKRKGEDVLYQLALEESRKEAERLSTMPNSTVSGSTLSQSALDDLLSLGLGQMTVTEPQPSYPHGSQTSAWDTPNFNDPWNPAPPAQQAAPQSLYPSIPTPTANDPWAVPSAPVASHSADPFGSWDAPPAHNQSLQQNNSDPFAGLGLAPMQPLNGSSVSRLNTKTPETFLGENSSLVNLDNLMGGPAPAANKAWNSTNDQQQQHGGDAFHLAAANPFLLASTQPAPVNPFTANQRKSPTLNEMRAGSTPVIPPTTSGARTLLPQPLQPQPAPTTNPFSGF
ncbi:hypothetical protein PENTCL1PPCAC_29454 [Pristionchus entomophagus]|uniref:ENTH domain-containing protein n=1 Tax=Pristionchus entomophagus TaxID=358040 RepID=A0AAV5UJP7_9BILA|nr:hypothetical protein PENTCL1PPCAC_29454 [Pristionchus entomophagus]